MCLCRITSSADVAGRGYVALAVAGPNVTKKKDLDTGKGGDREANMLAFAIEALNMVREVVGQQQTKI